MRAVMLEVPEDFLEDRRRKGHDKRDEVWAGVLHMVPPPAVGHNDLGRELLFALSRVAKSRGLVVHYEVGVFEPAEGLRNYRIPDLVVAAPEHVSKRGVEGHASLVVEILSPDDESRDKLPFYAQIGVREVWLIDPVTRVIEVFGLRDAKLVVVRPKRGVLRSSLGLELETIAGPKLQLRDGDTVDEI